MKSKLIFVLAVLVLFFVYSPCVFAATASFYGLGSLDGSHSYANGISADGSTVVGASNDKAFRWTAAGGMADLGAIVPGGISGNYAYGVSTDGSVIVGKGQTGSGNEAFRWTSGGMIGLGGLLSGSVVGRANAVSADGSIVVGRSLSDSGRQAFRWASGSMVGLGYLPGSGYSSSANGISADGSIIVGDSFSSSVHEAFYWTSTDGLVGLGDLSGGIFSSGANAVSADGSTIVGQSQSGSSPSNEAFRWTSTDGMVGLGALSGGSFYSTANAVSADGSIIVGQSNSGGYEAFIWNADDGMQSLKDVLANDYSIDMTGWTLSMATGISSDGLKIVGYGTNPNGLNEGWVATIPEPATVLLLGLGGVALLRKRK